MVSLKISPNGSDIAVVWSVSSGGNITCRASSLAEVVETGSGRTTDDEFPISCLVISCYVVFMCSVFFDMIPYC